MRFFSTWLGIGLRLGLGVRGVFPGYYGYYNRVPTEYGAAYRTGSSGFVMSSGFKGLDAIWFAGKRAPISLRFIVLICTKP